MQHQIYGYTVYNMNVSPAIVLLPVLSTTRFHFKSLLFFKFYEPVYYKLDDSNLPSDFGEDRGRWVLISENVGHAITLLVLTDNTIQLLQEANISSACDPSSFNLRLDPLNKISPSKSVSPGLCSRLDKLNLAMYLDHLEMVSVKLPLINFNDLIGPMLLDLICTVPINWNI
jgi:hypothetical protein